MSDITDIKAAKEAGMYVLADTDYMLMFDLDTEEAVDRYDKFNHLVDNYVTVADNFEWKSKSGNIHALYILEEPVDWPMRHWLQALCGSDLNREVACAIRGANDRGNIQRLFIPKEAVESNSRLNNFLKELDNGKY
jgi:hypothetical protein